MIRIALLLLLSTYSVASAEVVIKLGTLAPAGSTWHTLLKEMAQKWSETSGGQVSLKIFPGGVIGDEGLMVRKMQVGQIQAAAVTTVGMHDLTPEPQAVDVPLGISTYDELDYVMAKLEPRLNAALYNKGYVAINWSDVGFVQFFSTHPMCTPAQIPSAKLFAWDGDPKSIEAWRAGGFHPVVLSSTDIIPQLATGMVDTVVAAPLYAFTARIYQKANHVCELRWAVLTGATLVKREVWERIPAEVRTKLLGIAKEYGRRVALEVRRLNEDALTQMKKQGLVIDKVEDLAGWQRIAEKGNQVVRGGVVPADLYDEVIRLRNELRATHK